MPTDLSTLDLATLRFAESVILDVIRSKCCQWEQDSADATINGNLSTALVLKHWADAADLISMTVLTEFSGFFGAVLRARFGTIDRTSTRSAQDQILDALAVEVASAQAEPNRVTS
jgi:hypothetical protein